MGKEWNSIEKDLSKIRYRVALCYPDTYEIGMSHLGLTILYHIANSINGVYAERCFAPWPDMGLKLREKEIPLFSLETGTPLNRFDLIGFSLQHELLYSNVLYMLDLAGIPFRSSDRSDKYPLLIAGGCGAHTPEPLAELFDIFLPGDGEETLPILLGILKNLKDQNASRDRIIEEVVRNQPVAYAPSYYRPSYSEQGRLLKMEKNHQWAPDNITPGLLMDLDSSKIPEAPIQPVVRCIHERITLEIMRGCTRGCRFCQAGMTRRPLRTRNPDKLLDAAKSIYNNTGYDEISLCSLSTSDYPDLVYLMTSLSDHFDKLRVGLSIPSLRVGKKMLNIPSLSSSVRKAGLTLAPEAATEKLRAQINKPITDEDLEAGVLKAYELGWRKVKLYFMIGLPNETENDVKAIAKLARRISDLRKKTCNGPALVNVSISTFVPKAHTPFQWSAMARPEEIREKQKLLLRSGLPSRIKLSFHDWRMSIVEGMLARGDRRAFLAIIKAYESGASFDAWSEKFSYPLWEEAFSMTGLDPEEILHRERDEKELLPWEIINPGPSRDFLWKEFERSKTGTITPYCEDTSCSNCGIPPKICANLKQSRNKDNV